MTGYRPKQATVEAHQWYKNGVDILPALKDRDSFPRGSVFLFHRAAPQVRARRKVAARPPRISDADLKREVKAEFDADPSVSVNAAAKNLNRSRDRVRPLLEQVRREAHVSPIAARRQS